MASKQDKRSRLPLKLSLGTVAVLLTLEAGLRLCGMVMTYARARAVDAQTGNDPACLRILHIGESTTFGLGVAQRDAYPAQLTRLLQSRHPGRRFTEFNRGLPSLTTSSMVETFSSKIDAIHPNIVVIMAGANDYNEYLNGRVIDPADSALGGTLQLLRRSRLFQALRLARDLMRPEVRLEQGEVLYYRNGNSMNILYETPPDADKVARATRILERNLETLVREGVRSGAKVLIAGYIQSYEENKVLQRVAQRSGIPYVSTFLPRDRRPAELMGSDGWHPSALGHRHIAEQLDRSLDPLL